ncbi:MAG: NAD(P)-binding domain-containing protein, partial [Deltaproteobacteria bacterium]|nr:NAD(P)-binding domain-containing protein [Deltaproteobacteria bacterium]
MGIDYRSFVLQSINIGQRNFPKVKSDHQSSRPGLFICGDLAGNPTLKTSIRDGYETMRAAARWLAGSKRTHDTDVDVVICGAGASGIAAALEAKKLDLNAIIIEKNSIAKTVSHFPAGKKIWACQEKVELDTELWLDNCTKEELLKKWGEIINDHNIIVHEGKEITELVNKNGCLEVVTKDESRYSCGAVILAIGRSGNPRNLNVAGEDQEHVHHMLLHPHGYEEKNILVVGGGNSALEAANSLAVNGARVSISYRQEAFFRITSINRQEIDENIRNNNITPYFSSQVTGITQNTVTLTSNKSTEEIPVDDIFILIGADPPKKLLEKLGTQFENSWPVSRIINMVLTICIVWLLYAFFKWGDGTTLREFPFGMFGKSWDILPGGITPTVIKGILYTLCVVGFGIPALIHWRQKPRIRAYQTWRYGVIFFMQAVLLFLLPEFLIKSFDPDNYWRFYGLVLPFPLLYEIFFYGPPMIWIILCGIAAFIALPIFIYWHGKRLCSWICGCGCLSETLGDRYRHLAPQGDASRNIETPIMWAVLIWAFVSAGLFLVLKGGGGSQPWYVASYVYIVDFWLASVFGVALYFFLGNRIWCRYFCPLAHMMRVLSSWYSKFRIKPADRCIACGECSRYCQMGIDVMKFALKDQPVNNRNSSCIGCGICVSVCPMDNLTMGDRFPNEENYAKG